MPVPTYDKFIEPVLRHLANHPDGAVARDVHNAAAVALGLSDADRGELLPSGAQPVYKNRAGWAHDRLKRAGYSSSPRRGFWTLTTEGRRFVDEHPGPLNAAELEDLALGHIDVRLRPAPPDAPETGEARLPTGAPPAPGAVLTASPDDQLEHALAQLRESVAVELLEVVGQASPTFFEALVLDLLHAMGYGTSRNDLERVGGSGDGGIDGIISRRSSEIDGDRRMISGGGHWKPCETAPRCSGG